MALKRKITKITKDDQTSRRKRTKGLVNKSHELGIRPSCKVFTFVLYTDVGQVHTYDSTGGAILGEVEAVLERLVSDSHLLMHEPAPLMGRIAPFPPRLAAI
jgi:predicted oxidoreductase